MLRNLSSITLVLTSSCNLRCSYCYQNARSGRGMRWETARLALDRLLASERQGLEVIFYGGEPLLRFNLLRSAVDYVEKHRRPDQRVQFSTLTNGTLMGEGEAAFLAEHDFEVQLSLDGIPEVQSLRGEGTFELLDALLDRLREGYCSWFETRVSVCSTVLPSTVEHLAESVDYLSDKAVRTIDLSPEAGDSSSWRRDQIDELEEQFEHILQMSLRHYRRTGGVPVSCLRRLSKPRRLPRAEAMCNIERGEDLTVDVDGSIYGCAALAESYQILTSDFLFPRLSRLRLGTLNEPVIGERLRAFREEVVRAEIFHDHGSKHSSYGRCRDCEFLPDCQVCPLSISHIPGNTDPHCIPDFLCAFNRVSLRCQRRFAAAPSPWQWIKECSVGATLDEPLRA